MAIPALVAGAGLASRGLASYLAKQKAKKEMMKAGYGATRNASIPSLVSSRGRVYPRNLSDMANTSKFVSKKGIPGVLKRGSVAAIPVVAGTTAGIMQGGDGARQEGTYMANPMAGISQNPSYDASMTREGQIQTMMEEMDGMNLSEEAKRQIIQDKLGINYGYLEDRDVQAGYGGGRFDKTMTMNPGGTVVDPDGGYGGRPYPRIGKQVMTPFNAMTATEMKAATFDKIANDPSIPMDQRITAALRRETGAAFNPEEGIAMRARLEAMDAERRNSTGAGMTANEMRMFMGIPQ
jgi:hypothetical protein